MVKTNTLLETIKEQMIQNIESLNTENIEVVEEKHNELFAYANYLKQMPNYIDSQQATQPTKRTI